METPCDDNVFTPATQARIDYYRERLLDASDPLCDPLAVEITTRKIHETLEGKDSQHDHAAD